MLDVEDLKKSFVFVFMKKEKKKVLIYKLVS